MPKISTRRSAYSGVADVFSPSRARTRTRTRVSRRPFRAPGSCGRTGTRKPSARRAAPLRRRCASPRSRATPPRGRGPSGPRASACARRSRSLRKGLRAPPTTGSGGRAGVGRHERGGGDLFSRRRLAYAASGSGRQPSRRSAASWRRNRAADTTKRDASSAVPNAWYIRIGISPRARRNRSSAVLGRGASIPARLQDSGVPLRSIGAGGTPGRRGNC